MLLRKIFANLVKNKKYIKFLISGSLAAFVNLFSLFVFHGLLHIQVVVAASLAFVLAYFVSFTMQKFWTFADSSRERMLGQMIKYLLVGLFGLAVTAVAIYILVEIFLLWYLLAQIIITAFMAVVNYFLYRIIFRKTVEIKGTKSQYKKIIIATGIYPPDMGGPATYSQTLKNELEAKGFDLQIVSYGEAEAGDENNGIYRVSRKQSVLKRYFEYFRIVYKLARDTDLLYIQGPVSEGLPSYLAARLRRKKYILKVVGDFAWEQGTQRHGVEDNLDDFQTKNYSLKVELWRFVEIFVAGGAYLVITPSEYLKNIVAGWGVDRKNIQVIYNSVEVISNRDKQSMRDRLSLDGRIIVSASRLVPWKGFGTLIDLMSDIDAKLFIIGEGPLLEDLKVKIKDLGLDSKVKLLGGLDQADLWDYIVAADVFVLNTSYEGLSHLIIETMGLGTPVVTTRVGGNPELIEHGANGVLVDYNDSAGLKSSIERLLGDKNLAEGYREKSLEKVKIFSREKMINDLICLINNL